MGIRELETLTRDRHWYYITKKPRFKPRLLHLIHSSQVVKQRDTLQVLLFESSAAPCKLPSVSTSAFITLICAAPLAAQKRRIVIYSFGIPNSLSILSSRMRRSIPSINPKESSAVFVSNQRKTDTTHIAELAPTNLAKTKAGYCFSRYLAKNVNNQQQSR
jgi:hypothetical protein